jgi:hypothetical protein
MNKELVIRKLTGIELLKGYRDTRSAIIQKYATDGKMTPGKFSLCCEIDDVMGAIETLERVPQYIMKIFR